jgi:hypothetical protein
VLESQIDAEKKKKKKKKKNTERSDDGFVLLSGYFT